MVFWIFQVSTNHKIKIIALSFGGIEPTTIEVWKIDFYALCKKLSQWKFISFISNTEEKAQSRQEGPSRKQCIFLWDLWQGIQS